jgi:hypothetical protein
MAEPGHIIQERTPKKPSYPIRDELRAYLRRYRRERDLPVTYERLRDFHETMPLVDKDGKNTLWDTVIYRAEDMPAINEGLKRIYALLKVDGDFSVMQHLYIDRVDFCSFGNSMPFRIRIVNAYNENPDYFYVKKADASRVYGLELEHLLSPNRLNFLTHGNTLIEEHIAGVPGDVFIDKWLEDSVLRPIRIAKELVKFNERCFIRLLGDMRSYNFVVVITPDFEGSQIRIRAMDFDQQSHHGRMQRVELASQRLGVLLDAMGGDRIAPDENVHQLREGLADHYGSKDFLACTTMGQLVRESLAKVRARIEHDAQGHLPKG